MSNESKAIKNQPGLLNNGEPVFLAVAKIFKPHGLKGEVSAEILTDFPERLVHDKQVFIGERHIPIKINSMRKSDKKYLISFMDHESIDSIEKYRNKIVFIKEEKLPDLPEQEFYYHDLIGVEVVTIEGELVGILTEILRTGANDVYVVRPTDENREEILLPAIKSVIIQVDIEARKMVVHLQEWR